MGQEWSGVIYSYVMHVGGDTEECDCALDCWREGSQLSVVR